MATNLTWTGTTQYTDGKPYTQADHGGYEVEVNGVVGIAVPVAWDVDNQYTFPLADLPGVVQGANTVRMRTVSAAGVASEYTPLVSFEYRSVPQVPTNLAAE